MLLRLVSPVKRPGSKNGQLQKRVPTAVRDRMIGRTILIPLGDGTTLKVKVDKNGIIRSTLGVSDPIEVKARNAEAGAYLERLFKAEADNRPIELTQRHAVALAGMLYRAWVEGDGREHSIAFQQGPDGKMHRVYDDNDTVSEAGAFRLLAGRLPDMLEPLAEYPALEAMLGPIVDTIAARPDVMLPYLTERSRQLLLVEFARALKDAWEVRARQAEGNHRPDPNSERFPAWERPAAAFSADGEGGTHSSLPKVTLTGLVEDWWKENRKLGKAKSTYVNYKGVFKKLVAFLGLEVARKPTADDAQKLTAEDVVRYKEHRLNVDEVSPRTVNDNDLAALRSVLGWAFDNKKLPVNVALGIRLKGVEKETGRAFTEEEAKTILRAASALRWSGLGHEGTALAKRWLPWLMAYSGARVGEVGQLRKQDVTQVQEGDTRFWAYAITQEAGTVKGSKNGKKKDRHVPVHPHLVELGFIDMVEAAPEGYLFLTPNPKPDDPKGVLGPLKGLANRVRKTVREVVSDTTVDPNHGWRHRFTVLCYEHDVSEDLSRMIVGHSGKDVHAKVYAGKGAGLYREICKLPAIKLD